MGNTWITVICVLLGIMVSLQLGTYDLAQNHPEYQSVQNATADYYANITDATGKTETEQIIGNWLTPLLIGASTLGVLTYFVPGASSFAIPAAFAVALAVYFLQPINTLQAMGFPWFIGYPLILVFSVLFFIAMVDFIRG